MNLRRTAKMLLKRDLGLHSRRQVGWKHYKKAVTMTVNALKEMEAKKLEEAKHNG